jgi:hypothetical protein
MRMMGPTLATVARALALLGAAQAATVAEGPRPPCDGVAPEPALPAVGGPPNVQLWHAGELAPGWRPPACSGWQGLRFDQLVGLAGRLPAGVSGGDLLARFGAVSEWTGLRYWSATRRTCRELIEDAHALAGPGPDQRRPDFTPAEMVAGRELYFFQDDNGPGGGASTACACSRPGPTGSC